MESALKENHFRSNIDVLEQEKKRLDQEREQLLQVKNQENLEWQQRYQKMQRDHDEVMQNLKDANQQYLNQVGENEDLK